MTARPEISARDRAFARKARQIALVLMATMGLWMLAQLLGAHLGLPARYAFLFDFGAMAAFLWALIVTFQLRRARGKESPGPKPADANRG